MPCGEGIRHTIARNFADWKPRLGDRLKDIPLRHQGANGPSGPGNGLEAAATVLALHHNTLCPAVNTTPRPMAER